MKNNTDKVKRDYRADNDSAQIFEDLLPDDSWTEMAEKDVADMNKDKFGRPFEFSDRAVEWGMAYRAATGGSYRRALGAVNHFLRKHGHPEMSLTQFYDRAQTIAERAMCTCVVTDGRILAYGKGNVPPKTDVISAVDSTGESLNKYGGWLMHRWNMKKISGWIKLHTLIDTGTGEVLSFVITDESCGDVSCIELLVELAQEAGHKLKRILADAAYDKIKLWKKYWEMGIEYVVNIKSSLLGKFSGGRVRSGGCPFRAAQIRSIRENGRDQWKEAVGYGMRWKAECAFSDMKRMYGDTMRARDSSRMAAELYWIIRSHNLYKSIRAAVAGGRKIVS